jgi:hypothetical protein
MLLVRFGSTICRVDYYLASYVSQKRLSSSGELDPLAKWTWRICNVCPTTSNLVDEIEDFGEGNSALLQVINVIIYFILGW